MNVFSGQRMKILSVWGPWAQLLVLGIKDVENRGWSTSYRGLLAIHASKLNHKRAEVAEILAQLRNSGTITREQSNTVAMRVEDDRGHVIGVVRLAGVQASSTSPWWARGQYALQVNGATAITPIPHRGEQGLRDYVMP